MNFKKHISVYKGLPKEIYILFGSTVINKAGSFITPLMSLILIVKMGYSETEVGIFATIAMLTQTPFLMLGGTLSDKIGSKKIIVILHMLGALAYLACGFMKPGFTVAVFMILAADIYSMATPAFNAMVPAVTPAPLIKKAYSFMYLGLNLGLAVGPAIGGILFNNYLSLLFFIDAATTLLSALFILFFIKGGNRTCESSLQKEPVKSDISHSKSLFFFLCRNPVLVIFSVIMLVYNFCYIQWNYLLPIQAVEIFQKNGGSFFSMLISLNALTVIIVTPFITSLTEKTSALKSVIIGGIFYFISFLLFSINNFLIIFLTGIVIMTFGEILVSINSNHYIAQKTPKEYLGRANSFFSILSGTGFAMGPFVMGKIIAAISFHKAWLIVAALMLFGITFLFFIAIKIKEKSL